MSRKQKGEQARFYLVQKLVSARTAKGAIINERKGKIVEVSLVNYKNQQLEPAVGFVYNTDRFSPKDLDE